MARRARSAAPRPGRRAAAAPIFQALTVEGALIAPAQLALVADAKADGQEAADYSVPRGLTLRDEIPRYFRIAQALWRDLAPGEATSYSATVAFTEALLRDVLGFHDIRHAPIREQDGRTHPVTLEAMAGRVPVVVAPPSDPLDRTSSALSAGGRRASAALALQDWLNACDFALWGLACNGEKLRLVRDNPSLTRPAYIEADLRQMFEGDDLAEFTAFWLLLHASRFGQAGVPPTDCCLERWREAGQKQGVVARDRLREGVEEALKALGSGFLSHIANGELRRELESGALKLGDFHNLLLRLVYRLIFLLAAEDRNLLHTPDATAAARKLYADGYSLARMRTRAAKRSAWDPHDDLWDGLQVTFAALARGEVELGLPALGGLFVNDGLGILRDCGLTNRSLMSAVYRLAWLRDATGVQQVNWRDMETEELGSVYEALLELTPRLSTDGRSYGFAEGGETRGNERKTSGSYYTPDSLVQLLLNSALDPVLDRAERESEEPATALLTISVIDPACGSGHFLLAAARRIATRLARHRAGGAASAEDYRHALRDVVRACIHGIDRNPMAVELAKVALWIETVEPGKPLGFLDANIRCGDALLGVFDLSVLEKGIPDGAYKTLTGDDAEAARIAGKVNRHQRERRQYDLVAGLAATDLVRQAEAFAAMPEDDVASVERKAAAWDRLHAQAGWGAKKLACDLYVGAFLRPKRLRQDGLEQAKLPDRVPTTLDVWTALSGKQADPEVTTPAVNAAQEARAFHWPLEFPAAMARGGFDVVLGNPPWDVVQLSEEEYFNRTRPDIAALVGAARKRAIETLAVEHPNAYAQYAADKRAFESVSQFARGAGRFELTGRGRINTYALFSELFLNARSDRGRAGLIVPSGVVTDDTTSVFFGAIVDRSLLVSAFGFDNARKLFPAIHADTPFTLLTLGFNSSAPEFSAYLLSIGELEDSRRRYQLDAEDISRINPNTKTAPIFRATEDARITARIYEQVPILVDDCNGEPANPWGLWVATRLWNMSEDAAWFRTADQLSAARLQREGPDWVPSPHQGEANDVPGIPAGKRYRPLYEAKLIHQFDHRWATYDQSDSRDCSPAEKNSTDFEPTPRYWVPAAEIEDRLNSVNWARHWLIGWRNITNATNERTCIFSLMPRTAVGHTAALLFSKTNPALCAALLANLNSIVVDFVARLKVGGTHLTYSLLKQLPVIPPQKYTPADLEFIVSRVLHLTYTSQAMTDFARDLGYKGEPFLWDEEQRARHRAELDAWYARAYGLTRDELRYVLEPADTMGRDYPSETFRVLKEKECRQHGCYRTRKLVLEAWDRLETSGASLERERADA